MKRTDYFRLAKWLLQRESNRLLRGFGAGLCMDSVLPDCNPLTYLRGIRGRQGLHGHNAEITGKRICRLVISLTKAKKAGVLCGFRLGTALHYLADAFTYPHHACFTGSLSDHIAYEASLHRAFISYLADVATRGHGRIFRISAPILPICSGCMPVPEKANRPIAVLSP